MIKSTGKLSRNIQILLVTVLLSAVLQGSNAVANLSDKYKRYCSEIGAMIGDKYTCSIVNFISHEGVIKLNTVYNVTVFNEKNIKKTGQQNPQFWGAFEHIFRNAHKTNFCSTLTKSNNFSLSNQINMQRNSFNSEVFCPVFDESEMIGFLRISSRDLFGHIRLWNEFTKKAKELQKHLIADNKSIYALVHKKYPSDFTVKSKAENLCLNVEGGGKTLCSYLETGIFFCSLFESKGLRDGCRFLMLSMIFLFMFSIGFNFLIKKFFPGWIGFKLNKISIENEDKKNTEKNWKSNAELVETLEGIKSNLIKNKRLIIADIESKSKKND